MTWGQVMTTDLQDCPNCNKTGKCPKCDGKKYYRSWASIIITLGVDKDTCNICWGSGLCRHCKGTGLVPGDG
jgi:RNA polymerase subunit RPABC4/transcription elongation factor Spt4